MITKIKLYALGILGALAGFFALKARGDWHKAKREAAERAVRTVEAKSEHRAATLAADAKAAEKGAQAVRDDVRKARTGDRSHFENSE